MQYRKMKDGTEVSILGYGCMRFTASAGRINLEKAEKEVMLAIENGVNYFDTAYIYNGSEEALGTILERNHCREKVQIATKLPYYMLKNAASVEKLFQEQLRRLRTDYIDLMLLHQPFCDRYGAYRALEDAYREGKVRAIGVSNFYPDHLIDLAANVEIAPMVNQVETHVFNQQIKAQKYMEESGTQIMSWGPLAEGRNNFFTNPVQEIGHKYGKSVAQVALRWLVQRGVIIIPKSVHVERMKQNLDILDFKLYDEDMNAIATLDTGKSLFFDHHDPEVVKMFMRWR